MIRINVTAGAGLQAPSPFFAGLRVVIVPILRSNLAVMSIFRALHVPVLGRLEMADLRAQWPRYALRQRDLDRSIDRLESLGMVRVDPGRRGCRYVVLTEMGYRSAHSLVGLIESLMVWPRRLLALVLGLVHRRGGNTSPAQRRQTDRNERDSHPT